MKKENNKGITLIALVITIIIMIILVAVSVALVVKGDLFGNAQEGTDKTRIEAEKEQLTEYVYGQYKQNEVTKKVEVNLNEVKGIVDGDKEKFDGAAFEGDTLKVTGKSGEIYYITKDGKISDNNSKSSETKFPEENYKVAYARPGQETYCWVFIKEGETVKGYAIDYDNSKWNIDKRRENLNKITYSEFLSQLNESGVEYNLNLEGADGEVFCTPREIHDDGKDVYIDQEYYVFKNNYTILYKVDYIEEDGEIYIDEDSIYNLKDINHANIDEILANNN